MENKQVLRKEIDQICEKLLWDEAQRLASIPGCQVNYAFFERKITITNEIIVEALKNLGVDFSKVKGRKWYQFWLDDFDVKLTNAINLISNTSNPCEGK